MPNLKPNLNLLSCLAVACLALALCAAVPAQAAPQTYTNSIGMEFVLIPAGSFLMGCENETDSDCHNDEKPRHRVTITRPFYLGKYEVTQAQWEAVMGSNPSKFKGAKRPVERVAWEDAMTFIHRLNQREGAKRYRLPTEAEWEYACRAGSTTKYHFGNDKSQLDRYAWCFMNRGTYKQHRPVGQKQPNAWGLYDMYGNVQEWVWDWYDRRTYQRGEARNPTGPQAGEFDTRVIRGCAYNDYFQCYSAYRKGLNSSNRQPHLGLRLALSPEH